MKVRSQTRLARRGTVYYFRSKIPVDLKHHFAPNREIMESLRTSDKKEAEQLVRIKSVELDQQFAELRRQKSSAPKTTISDVEVRRIVAKAAATRMKADEESRFLGESDRHLERQVKRLEEAEQKGLAAVSRGDFAGLEPS